ncbi:MAG: hypothetical protein ACO3UU_04885, partial [Minisyncoccia bacterium]
MAISRMQMDRQLYEGGGIITLTPRSKYGLGSSLKKFVRKIIPNEVSEIAVKAAPFVAPFNPLLAGAMAGIGSFDQTGSISKGLKSGLLNYGGGQLERYIGGAGFQEGINPFAGADFSGGFLSGIQSLGTSPIGTETGLRLGQYKMFGGTPTQEIVSSGQPPLASEGSIATGIDSSKAYYPTDFATEALPLEQATTGITTAGQTAAQTAAQKATTPGYMDLTKKVLSGNLQEKTQALKQLGGKALKDIYTKPVPGSPGETQIDKLAIGATIAGGMSYLEAKKLAEEAGIVDNADEYTEEMYNADKSRYSNYYSQILTPEAFGITSKADGGRVGFAYGTPSQESGIPSITLTKQDNTEVAGLSKNRVAQLMSLLEDPNIDEDYRKQIQDEIRLLMSKKDGGRIGFFEGTDDPQGRRKGIVSINPMEEDIEEGLTGSGVGSLVRKVSPYKYKGGVGGGKSPFTKEEISFLFKTLGKTGGPDRKYTMPQLSRILNSPGKFVDDEKALAAFLKVKGFKEGGRIGLKGGSIPNPNHPVGMTNIGYIDDTILDFYYGGDLNAFFEAYGIETKAEGGRIGFMMGSEVPVRENQAGVREMDYRNTGGFVPPIGVKEKADDIPAMLSNNEFVFTADAVRAAGGGSVNKGAQK